MEEDFSLSPVSPVSLVQSPSVRAGFAAALGAGLSPSPIRLRPPLPDQGASARCEAQSEVTFERRMWRLDDFVAGPRIGVGNFGHVQLAKEKRTSCTVVLKVMKKRRIERLRMRRHVEREITIQQHLRHQNVLRLFGYFWDASHIFMVLERASAGDLYSLLQKQPGQRFDADASADFAAQLVRGLGYLHGLHVIHRDVKPENMLALPRRSPAPAGSLYSLKIADFGWAVHTYPDDRRWTLCGTLDYLPPEMVHVTRGHSFPVDAWSLGALTYELLVGRPPFAAATHEDTYRNILQASPTFPQGIPENACDFVRGLLRRDPDERMKLDGTPWHRWIQGTDPEQKEVDSYDGVIEAEYSSSARGGA